LEPGYSRFFNTLLFFNLGYTLTVLSGNFETLFIGWEFLGISSFLLVAFYRERYLPVRNAVRVFSVYRIGDIGVLLAMWASHHLWQENITFFKLNHYELVHHQLSEHSLIGIGISLCLLVAAAAKSAQWPFCSWLPRAMEGPTPSSAIFYGSLSVHFGVFLLLRTYPFWEHQYIARWLIGGVGAISAIAGFAISNVQTTIKTRIAYASVAQIGIMFIEIALGFKALALFHFMGNAFLRSYQLLVSPSVISYMIRDQLYHYHEKVQPVLPEWRKKLEATIYTMSIQEWGLEHFINKIVFSPIKTIGHKLDFLTKRNVLYYVVPVFALACCLYLYRDTLYPEVRAVLPALFAGIGWLMVLKAFSERHFPRLSWMLVLMNHGWVALAVSFNEDFDWHHTLFYLSGFVPAGLIGYLLLRYLLERERPFFNLNGYYGHAWEYPRLAFFFLLCCLGLMGFPITYSFVGEDLLFSHIHSRQLVLAFFASSSFVLGGIALIRVYARLFLGPHIKKNHETSLKSS
jgi:NADH:ubiquinone oxidoreductase subunit 5 (subunit L)/multisubunit Na+/H+ antiporter MnhA subunit